MDSLFWLLLNIIATVFLAFYSMGEMALVSFNKIRLQFYKKESSKRAEWLNYLLKNPSRLFGTTLIGVNVAMMFGSEFGREFFNSAGIDPDLAPLFQVPFVIIFGELAPQFAARRFSEHVALLVSPLLYFSSKVMAPFVISLGWISKVANKLLGGHETHHELFLTLEELQKILEEQEDDRLKGQNQDFDSLVASIFRLRGKTARKIMTPLREVFMLSASTTVAQFRKSLKRPVDFVPIYNKEPERIIGITFIRDLIRANDTQKIRDFSRAPWFITENTPLLQILKQFRKSSQTVACVLNSRGQAEGFLSLDDLLEDIFGKDYPSPSKARKVIDVTVPGEMSLQAFNKEFGVELVEEGAETISDYLLKHFEHHPEVGESFLIPPYELIIKESSILDIKSIQVKSRT